MLFDTPQFFIFFAITLAIYYCVTHRWQNLLLVLSSYVFYSYWDWRFCSLLFVSTVLDYWCGLKIPGRYGKAWVTISVVGQLLILGFFKYYNFFEESTVRLLESVGFKADWVTLKVIVPVGISFYSFQTLSYTIDIWRGRLKPIKNFVDFSVFVSFWPHLVAGPILRASYMLPQITKRRLVTRRHVREGTYFILAGLVKKVAVADIIAGGIQDLLGDPLQYSSWQLTLGIYLFALRIYGDFCGYTDIARGVSLLMGFDLQENFHFPYFARSIQDFWRRWHISLSTWLRDYLYISLGGSRCGAARMHANLMITMVLGGLWHGASWSFVVWGTLHGALLIAHRLARPILDALKAAFARLRLGLVYTTASILTTFAAVCLTWVFFVITDVRVAWAVVLKILQFDYTSDPVLMRLAMYSTAVLLAVDVPEMVSGKHEYLASKTRIVRVAVYALMVSLLIMTWTTDYEPFIYFQF